MSLPLLNDKSEFVRRETAYALGETKNPQVAYALLERLLNDRKRSVRDACAFALGKSGNITAIPTLTAILEEKPKKKRRFFRRAAARSIGQIVEATQARDISLNIPESFLPPKYKGSQRPKHNDPKHNDIVQKHPVLRSAISVLIKSLQNPREFSDVKREAAFALGAIGDESAVPVLRANLNNQDYYLAEACKEAIQKIGRR